MKSPFISGIILLALAICYFPGSSKPRDLDYLVTIQGDTLTGIVKKQGKNAIKFRKIGESASQIFQAKDIRSYYLNKTEQKYISLSLTQGSQPVLVWQKQEGPIKLLVYQEKFSGYTGPHPGERGGAVGPHLKAINYVYIQKNQQVPVKIQPYSTKTNKMALKDLIGDVPALAAELQIQQTVNEHTLNRLIQWYNEQKTAI